MNSKLDCRIGLVADGKHDMIRCELLTREIAVSFRLLVCWFLCIPQTEVYLKDESSVKALILRTADVASIPAFAWGFF